MARINLRDLYPHYCENCFIDVPDEILEAIAECERQEATYLRRLYRNKAQYSLNQDDGIEKSLLLKVSCPHEVYEQKMGIEVLNLAIAALTKKQAQRVYAHFFLGLSKAEIARSEAISEKNICKSIDQAIKNIRKSIKIFFSEG